MLSSLDLFIVNVALPQISRGFHGASLSDLSWVLNAYAVVFAALLVPAGRLADRAGQAGRLPDRRRDLHGVVRGLRRGEQRRAARRVPDRPGRRRGTADPDLARSRPRRVSARATRGRGADLDGDERARRGCRPGARRACSSRRAGAGCSSSTSRSGSPRSSPAAACSPARRPSGGPLPDLVGAVLLTGGHRRR